MFTMYFFISLFVCMLCMASLLALRKHMPLLLLLHGYFVGTILLQQSFTVFALNLHFVKLVLSWQSFWSTKLPGLFCQPALLLWALLPLLSGKYSLGGRIFLLTMVLLLMTLVDISMNRAGFIEVIHWNVFYSLLRYVAILLIVWGYLALLRRRMRQEGVAGV